MRLAQTAACVGGPLCAIPQAEYVLRCTREALPFRNKLAGRATLELGTVLDAQGKYEEAAEMYRSLLQHPDRKVRKDATRLVEGIEALAYFNYAKADSKEDSYAPSPAQGPAPWGVRSLPLLPGGET